MKKVLSMLLSFVMIFSTVVFADTMSPYRDGFIEGYIKAKLNNAIQIEEYDGTLHTLSFTKDAVFVIDQTSASSVDFIPGMEIYATLQGRSINYIESYSTQNLGYIKEESKLRLGMVKSIDTNQITVKTDIAGDETYYVTPSTLVLKGSNKLSLSSIYEGDRIKLYFSDATSNIATKIVIQGSAVNVKNLYKAKITAVDEISDKIMVDKVEAFKNGNWESYSDMMEIPITSDIPLYVGSGKLLSKNLKYYKGQTVYMAVKDYFGNDKIDRLVVKNQYESQFTDKIEDINWYSEKMELKNNQNISFSDSTIVIKSGRIVDKYALTEKSDAYIVADGRDTARVADIIYILNEDINNSNVGQNYIYSGKFKQIEQYSLKLEDFYVLNKNTWESFAKKKDFYYDEDSYIYDVDKKKRLNTQDFFALNAENINYYTYMYTDGDRIVGALVQRKMDSLLKQRTSNAIVQSVQTDKFGANFVATLQDVKDWSDRKEQWLMRNSSLNLILDNALIIKNDKYITPSDLMPGDRVYVQRDDIYGKVVIVK